MASNYTTAGLTQQPLLLHFDSAQPLGSDVIGSPGLAQQHHHHHNGNLLPSNASHQSMDGGVHAPAAFDPGEYDHHVDVFFYPGDVSHLTLPWVREPNFVTLAVVYTLTFALGVLGNGLVISVLCCRRSGRCITFPCLLSMAWADVLFLLVCVPHEVVGYFLTHWGLSSFLCKLSGFVEMASAMATILNLILISVER